MPLPTSRAKEFWTRWKILHIRQLAETGRATNELWLPEAERTGRALDQLYLKRADAPGQAVVADTTIRFAAGSPLNALLADVSRRHVLRRALGGAERRDRKGGRPHGNNGRHGRGRAPQGGRRVQPDNGPVGVGEVRRGRQLPLERPGRGHQDRPGRKAGDRRPPPRGEGHNADIGDEANPRGHGRDIARPPP